MSTPVEYRKLSEKYEAEKEDWKGMVSLAFSGMGELLDRIERLEDELYHGPADSTGRDNRNGVLKRLSHLEGSVGRKLTDKEYEEYIDNLYEAVGGVRNLP